AGKTGRSRSLKAEEIVVRPAIPRKSLPSYTNRPAQSQRTGITAGWRLKALWEPEQQADSLQAMSEEGQTRITEVEMQLPRIAGQNDPWPLITLLTVTLNGAGMICKDDRI